jgi:hypothetical protein
MLSSHMQCLPTYIMPLECCAYDTYRLPPSSPKVSVMQERADTFAVSENVSILHSVQQKSGT